MINIPKATPYLMELVWNIIIPSANQSLYA